MNKYNIEVGDKLGDDAVTYVDKHGISFLEDFNSTTDKVWHLWNKVNSNIEYEPSWKLTKMNKKIIGYTLLKDTPDLPKGTVFKLNTGEYKTKKAYKWRTELGEDDWSYYSQEEVEKTEWFSPIYEVVKPTEVYVDTLAGKVKVTKSACSIGSNEIVRNPGTTRLLDIIKTWQTESFNYEIKVETFKVGCKTFHVSDIPKIEEAIKQVS